MEHKTKMAKQRIVVMYGGKADEHSISCISAAGVLRALDTDKFEAIEVGITKNGEWIVGGEDPRKWNMSEGLPWWRRRIPPKMWCWMWHSARMVSSLVKMTAR